VQIIRGLDPLRKNLIGQDWPSNRLFIDENKDVAGENANCRASAAGGAWAWGQCRSRIGKSRGLRAVTGLVWLRLELSLKDFVGE